MKTKLFLALLLLNIASSFPQLAHADEDTTAQLQQAATGATFKIGATAFRLVPNARVEKLNADAGEQDRPKAELARIGPYSISLTGGAGGNTAAATGAAKLSGGAAHSEPFAVVVNQRSGAPALLTSRLKVYCKETGEAAALAQASKGKVLLASSTAQLLILDYASPAAALAAMPLLQNHRCVKAVEPEIHQSFARSDQLNRR